MAEKQAYDIPPFLSFTKAYHNKPYAFISPTRPELSVAGKNVVVAGGGTGIGKATAVAFAQAGAASVSILGRRRNRLEEAARDIASAGAGTRVLYESVDFSQTEAAETGLKKIADQVGQIDIFIWSAGILPKVAEVQGYNVEDFRHGLELIVVGAFNALQALLPLAAADAKIFNISTGIAHMKPIKGLFNYALTKLAAVKMFDYLAAESPGLHVVNIQPGVVNTEINKVEGQDERKTISPRCLLLEASASAPVTSTDHSNAQLSSRHTSRCGWHLRRPRSSGVDSCGSTGMLRSCWLGVRRLRSRCRFVCCWRACRCEWCAEGT